MSYMTISSQEKHNFSLCSCFHAHPTTLLLKILGETNAWAVPPPQILGGPSPQSPLGLRPCIYCMCDFVNKYICKLCMHARLVSVCIYVYVCLHVCMDKSVYVCVHECVYVLI